MTVMVPMIRMSLILSVMMASAPCQTHTGKRCNLLTPTSPPCKSKLINARVVWGFFPVVSTVMGCKGVAGPKNTSMNQNNLTC